ncbi:14563_t:CDS:2, partial [Gigaspora rosea]
GMGTNRKWKENGTEVRVEEIAVQQKHGWITEHYTQWGTIKVKLALKTFREGGPTMLLKVATGINKGFCKTEVSQAQKMSQNKKKMLEEKDILDIHKATNLKKRITTWVGRESEMKIDYIWVSKSWNNSIFSCKVYDADQITASNHKIILGKIETGMHMRKNTFARLWRKDRETLSIDSDKETEDDWNAYN